MDLSPQGEQTFGWLRFVLYKTFYGYRGTQQGHCVKLGKSGQKTWCKTIWLAGLLAVGTSILESVEFHIACATG